MEINDINKVASRKRINVEAEKLREKVSRETAKIIKLKVAQDTAYWDLKEKLQQVESNHEKLQQNMVEVQMQHEAISGQYQEELRLRPDTLNKLTSTRAICDVLEDYSERLKDTLSRCKADQTVLCDAYQRSGQLVREIKTKHVEVGEKSRCLIEGLEEKVPRLIDAAGDKRAGSYLGQRIAIAIQHRNAANVLRTMMHGLGPPLDCLVKLMSEHQNQLLQFFTAAKQQADAEIGELRNKLASTTAHKEDLIATQNDLNRKLDQLKFDIEKKEEINANLRAEIKKIMQEFTIQASEARDVLSKQDTEIKGLNEENEALKKGLSNQEQFTKTVLDKNSALQENIAVLEDEQIALAKVKDDLKLQCEEATSLNRNLQNSIKILNDEKQQRLQEIHDTQQVVNKLEQEIHELKTNYSKLETEKSGLLNELNTTVEESTIRMAEIEKLTNLKVSLDEKVAKLEADFKMQKNDSEEKINELNSLIEAKVKEIDSKASTVSQLMSELKTSTDIRSKLEVSLQKTTKDIEIERETAKEKEMKMNYTIGQLETVIRTKDDELSKQMSIILEMRNEKERLQDKIQSMQNTIDNIQKELTRPSSQADPTTRQQPEQDDNAVMLTPSHKQTELMQPLSPILSNSIDFLKPRAQEPNVDNIIFNMFSDSSMDGDSLDPLEVTRRFNALARGEKLPPVPLSALKRRARTNNAADNDVRKPKVKNDSKTKERTFFKNKRSDNNTKRTK